MNRRRSNFPYNTSLQSQFLLSLLLPTIETAGDKEDLNHASDAEVAAAKRRMDVIFQQNLRKPDAPGYVHDMRRDFGEPEEECDWDEDST